MCGFLYHQKKNIYREKLQNFNKASRLLYKRGPDKQKFLIDSSKRVFHARLKIIDLKNRASQPFNYQQYSIIYNGEIYNYKFLKKQLSKKFSFKTNSDTEVLLYSYLYWKENMFKKIEGMYSFLIFNKNNNNLFFARDKFGQKPLYYYKDTNQIIFSSEIKPIILLLKKKEIKFEKREIYKYLNQNYYGDEKYTFFKHIYQVPLGSCGTFINNSLKIRNIKINKFRSYNKKNIEKAIKISLKLIQESDVETAILYSNGADSKSIYDFSKKINKKIKLFHVSFDKNEIKKVFSPEEKNLKKICFVKPIDFIKLFNKAAFVSEAPILSLFSLAYMKLFELIKKNNIKVVISGQGADEMFGGYEIFRSKIKKISGIITPFGEKILTDSSNFFKKNIFNCYLGNSFKEKKDILLSKSKIPKNLNELDKFSMNYSVECRSPYLTNILYENTSNLKNEDVYSNGLSKYFFRKFHSNLNQNNTYLTKKNYDELPQEKFLKSTKIKNNIKKIIFKKNYCDIFFKKKNFIKYYYDFIDGKNNGFLLWQYLSLNAFCNVFKKINM